MRKKFAIFLSLILLGTQFTTVKATDLEPDTSTAIPSDENSDMANSALEQPEITTESLEMPDDFGSTTEFSTEEMKMPEITTAESKPLEMPDITPSSQERSVEMTLDEFKSSIKDDNGSYEDVFTLMKNSVDKGESISLKDALSVSGNLTIPDNMMFDLSDSGISGTLDTSTLNLQFANILANMEASTVDLSSKAVGAASVFQAEYGNLAAEKQANMKENKLPKDFSLSKMTKANNKAIKKTYNKAYKDKSFQKIRKSIDTSSVVKKAAKGVKKSSKKKSSSKTDSKKDTKKKSSNSSKKSSKTSNQTVSKSTAQKVNKKVQSKKKKK